MRNYIVGANDPVPKRYKTSKDFEESVKQKISNPTVNNLREVANVIRQTSIGKDYQKEVIRRLKTNRETSRMGGSVKLSRNTSQTEEISQFTAPSLLHKSMTFNANQTPLLKSVNWQNASMIANQTFNLNRQNQHARVSSESPHMKALNSSFHMDKKI